MRSPPLSSQFIDAISNHTHMEPGRVEVLFGPMRSGKSQRLAQYISWLEQYARETNYLAFRPAEDTRDTAGYIASNDENTTVPCYMISGEEPEQAFEYVTPDTTFVVFDEAEMFSRFKLFSVAATLKACGYHGIYSGLDLDYRGEQWGPIIDISHWLVEGDGRHHLLARCDYQENGERCGRPAPRTQRLRNGEPEEYHAEQMIVEGSQENIAYYPVCSIHHHINNAPREPDLARAPPWPDEVEQIYGELRNLSLPELDTLGSEDLQRFQQTIAQIQ